MPKQDDSSPEEILHDWRTKILNVFLIIVAVAGTIMAVVRLLDVLTHPDQWPTMIIYGLLDLVFTPEGARAADKDFGFAASRYVQPVGCFTGSVRADATAPARPVTALLGVTEDHHSRW